MADRFWVGGTANWDFTAGTKWATTSGGTGGASAPTSSDDVFFDAASGAVTVSLFGGICRNLNCTGFTGTFSGNGGLTVWGSLLLVPGMGFTYTGGVIFNIADASNHTITSAGKIFSFVTFGSSGAVTGSWTLQDAFVCNSSISFQRATLNTGDYNVTASSISSNSTFARTLNCGSSTITLTGSTPINYFTSGLMLNAGTSHFIFSNVSPSPTISFPLTFYNVSFNNAALSGGSLGQASLTYNNLFFARRTAIGVAGIYVGGDIVIAGTLTFAPGLGNPAVRFVFTSNTNLQRTITCAALAPLFDIDFQNIAITGAVVPASGTRLGDQKNNTGIVFDAPKTVYFRGESGDWALLDTPTWSFTNGGTPDTAAFPLPQDTVVFPASYPLNGATVNINSTHGIGTIDMSARTSNTMTLSIVSSISVFGDWINGTGTTLSGTNTITFSGRNNQTLTSAGRPLTGSLRIDTFGGTVTLNDALTLSYNVGQVFGVNAGGFNAAGYSVTLSGSSSGFSVFNNTDPKIINLGSGTWTIAGGGGGFGAGWVINNSTNLTVTGTGIINMTGTNSKTFAGGGIKTYPTINQGGAGSLTITGANKFADITNTANGEIVFPANVITDFDNFNLAGTAESPLPITSSSSDPVSYNGIAHNGSLYVMVGSTGIIRTSPDGYTWTERTSGTTTNFTSVEWGGTQFLAVGDSGMIRTSPDGVTWTARTSGVGTTLNSSAWNGSLYVVVGNSGVVLTSPDAVTWTIRSAGSFHINDVVWSGSQFVTVGNSGTSFRSSNGTSWTGGQNVGTLQALRTVTWNGSIFVACGDQGNCFTGTTGASWTSRNTGASQFVQFLSSAWNGSLFVITGGGVLSTSPDGITWTLRTAPTPFSTTGLVWGGDKFVGCAGGNSGRIIYGSSNGLVWYTSRAFGATAILRKTGTWNIGSNSFDLGKNTGLNFTGDNPNYLVVSFINGTVVSYGNFFAFF